jgi:hypothetical protein
LAEVENKGILIIVGILSLMLLIPIIETGGAILAILFIILAIVGLKVMSSSKTDVSSWSNNPFQTINPMVQKQSLDEESWSDAIKKVLFILILSGFWGFVVWGILYW